METNTNRTRPAVVAKTVAALSFLLAALMMLMAGSTSAAIAANGIWHI